MDGNPISADEITAVLAKFEKALAVEIATFTKVPAAAPANFPTPTCASPSCVGGALALLCVPLLLAPFAESRLVLCGQGHLITPAMLPGEACEGCPVAICCDNDPFTAPAAGKLPTCDCNGKPYVGPPPDLK